MIISGVDFHQKYFKFSIEAVATYLLNNFKVTYTSWIASWIINNHHAFLICHQKHNIGVLSANNNQIFLFSYGIVHSIIGTAVFFIIHLLNQT